MTDETTTSSSSQPDPDETTGEQTPPEEEPTSSPEPAPEATTDEPAPGEPAADELEARELTDAEQGVGVAPTQPGDPDPEEGEPTPFRPSSDFEGEPEEA